MTLEAQIPIADNPNNPFDGRKRHQPILGRLPPNGGLRQGEDQNPFHFHRLQHHQFHERFHLGPVEPFNINTPLPIPVGKGNETDGLETPLSSNSYSTWVFGVDTGVSF